MGTRDTLNLSYTRIPYTDHIVQLLLTDQEILNLIFQALVGMVHLSFLMKYIAPI